MAEEFEVLFWGAHRHEHMCTWACTCMYRHVHTCLHTWTSNYVKGRNWIHSQVLGRPLPLSGYQVSVADNFVTWFFKWMLDFPTPPHLAPGIKDQSSVAFRDSLLQRKEWGVGVTKRKKTSPHPAPGKHHCWTDKKAKAINTKCHVATHS